NSLLVVSSEPLDEHLFQQIAPGLGEITLYSSAREPRSAEGKPQATDSQQSRSEIHLSISSDSPENSAPVTWRPVLNTGSLPAAQNLFDSPIPFGTPLPGVDWPDGKSDPQAALVRVQTRPSVLYNRLFAALGDFAKGIELILLAIAVVLAIIELL